MQPGGVEQFLRTVRAVPRRPGADEDAGRSEPALQSTEAGRRTSRKEASRLERQLARLTARENELQAQMAAQASDYVRLGKLQAQLLEVLAERDVLEEQWLEAAELADG